MSGIGGISNTGSGKYQGYSSSDKNSGGYGGSKYASSSSSTYKKNDNMGGYTGGKYDDDSNFKGSLDKYRKKKDHNDESEKLPNFNSNSSAKKPTEKRKTDTNEEVPKKAF